MSHLSERFDVCAVVVSHLPHDARVWKEARSLAEAGMSVRLIGLNYDLEETRTTQDGSLSVVEFPFGQRGDSRVFNRIRVALQPALAVLRTPADIYHCHNIHLGVFVLIAALTRQALIVYDAHELYGEPPMGGGLRGRFEAFGSRLLERALMRRATAVITTNASRAEVLGKRYGRDDVTAIANVPVLVKEVEPTDPGFPDAPILLYQGGIYAEERVFRETISALRLLPGVAFAVVGFGRDADLERLRVWACEENVDDRVHIYGPVPFDQLIGIAASATVGIVPLRNINLGAYLGDTNKLFEYLMAGLPVVGSDFPEVARVLSEGEPPVGEAFDPEDPESIAAAIKSVLGTRYEERRREARRLAVEKYHWAIEAKRLIECFEAVSNVRSESYPSVR